jgi:protein-S-isoprenylcysteine O-methyltransferase Ste14
MIKRTLILTYGILSYAIFFGTFLYGYLFIGNLGSPTALDGPAVEATTAGLLLNIVLLTVFAIQHSVMARPGFKSWVTRYIPRAAERSTYVLFSSFALILLFWQWSPLGGVIWHIENPSARLIIYAIYTLGWLIVLASSFLINHFDLFGLRQVWLEFQDKPYTPLPFTTPGPYKIVRHPLYVGWLVAFWATPTMTISHLIFALGTTIYILLAIRWEERDLLNYHPEYATYRSKTPMLVPGIAKSESPKS